MSRAVLLAGGWRARRVERRFQRHLRNVLKGGAKVVSHFVDEVPLLLGDGCAYVVGCHLGLVEQPLEYEERRWRGRERHTLSKGTRAAWRSRGLPMSLFREPAQPRAPGRAGPAWVQAHGARPAPQGRSNFAAATGGATRDGAPDTGAAIPRRAREARRSSRCYSPAKVPRIVG